MATLEDLMQQLLESSMSGCKEMSEESTTSTKKAASAEKKAMLTSSGRESKPDPGRSANHKGKAVEVEQAREEPEPQATKEKEAVPMTDQRRKTITVTVCEDCLFLHCLQCKKDNAVTYKRDYKYPAQERASSRAPRTDISSHVQRPYKGRAIGPMVSHMTRGRFEMGDRRDSVFERLIRLAFDQGP